MGGGRVMGRQDVLRGYGVCLVRAMAAVRGRLCALCRVWGCLMSRSWCLIQSGG